MKRAVPLLFISFFLYCQSYSQSPVISRLIGNERLGKKDSVANWTIHFQLTGIMQGHPKFKAAYSGKNSVQSRAENGSLSLTSTLFLGRKLWKGAAIYFNPEVAGGSGISSTKGVAGFPNGETFRVGDPSPVVYIARTYFQQHISLKKNSFDTQESDANQLAGRIPAHRITISVGKFCMADFLDGNAYSHDPRTQFMNWALMSNGAWDYPANTRGYTYAAVLELVKPMWSLRLSTALMPRQANGPKLDWHYDKSNSEAIEFEKKWNVKSHAGAARLMGYFSMTKAPTYKAGIAAVLNNDTTVLDVITGAAEWNNYGGIKYGFGISADQEIVDGIGIFARGGWNDGKSVTWAYTEIDHHASVGYSMDGRYWKRPTDVFAIAGLVNGVSKDHREFLKTGGYGFIIGDGNLNYSAEGIMEVYYKLQIASFISATLDYQFIANPAYNKDRGPVHALGLRVHVEI